MCNVCKGLQNIHERGAAHDFHEQMAEFYGISINEPKKKRLTKKSIIDKVKYQLEVMAENEEKNALFITKLNEILSSEIKNVKESHKHFQSVMQDYYIDRINEEMNNAEPE